MDREVHTYRIKSITEDENSSHTHSLSSEYEKKSENIHEYYCSSSLFSRGLPIKCLAVACTCS